MARPLRIAFPGAFYHVTARGNERKAVFKSIRDRQKFLEYLETATARYNALIHAYCLMDNHYHLLLETPSGNLPQIMRHINGAYTTYFNVKRARAGHLFQGRYKAIVVQMDAYAKELSRYIHLNPVRAKLAETPDKYEWSSYNFYIGVKKAPGWLHRDFILGYFGDKVSNAQLGYKKFVSLLIARQYDSPLKEVTASVLLGSQDFIQFIKGSYLSDKKLDRDLPAIRQLGSRITCLEICDMVELEFRQDPVAARNIKLYLCRKHTGERLRTIGAQFGIGDAAVTQACKRFKLKLEKDRKLRKKIEQFEKKLFL
ncbi:transposase [Thermodesulfobacteriota bacterium]